MNRLALLMLCVLSVPALAQEQVRPEFSGANFRPLPLAVPAPLADPAAAKAARDFDQALLLDSLGALGTFQLLDRKGFLADANEGLEASGIKFGRWADVGAEGLVKTRVTVTGDEVQAELFLYNVGSAKEELRSPSVARSLRPAAWPIDSPTRSTSTTPANPAPSPAAASPS